MVRLSNIRQTPLRAGVRSWVARRFDASRERGAVLALVAITLVLVMVSGAVAVDLSALDRQGQTLQNTADAAALAGVAEWVESNDQDAATAVVEDLITQNGIEIGDEVELLVTFPNALEVQVDLVDTAPDVFLAGFVGVGNQLERDATARLERCDDGCNRIIEIPPPVNTISAKASGDGFIPTAVNQRLYAVNHHSSTMACVDRIAVDYCWPEQDRSLFSPKRITHNAVHPSLHGDRIYYVGHSDLTSFHKEPTSGNVAIGCFNVTTDSLCPIGPKIWNEGHGMLAGTDDALYVFTSTRKVHCFVPITLARCSGWSSSGENTALSSLPSWDWRLKQVRNWTSSNIQLDGKIYTTLTRENRNNGGFHSTWLHCWDSNDDEPCDGFGAVQLFPGSSGDNYSIGRLFFYRDVSGNPQAICSTGRNEVACFDLEDGSAETGYANTMWATVSQIDSIPSSTYIGVHTYHEESNRLFMVGHFPDSDTHCHDFTNANYCGVIHHTTPLWGSTGTYGYWGETNCLIGYGHESIFFTLKPDMSGPCDGSSIKVPITPCSCGGVIVWPPVSAVNLDGVSTFEVRVKNPDGEIVMPTDGGWIDMTTNVLDLTPITDPYPELTIEIQVEPDAGVDPWDDDSKPTFVIGISSKDPKLVE